MTEDDPGKAKGWKVRRMSRTLGTPEFAKDPAGADLIFPDSSAAQAEADRLNSRRTRLDHWFERCEDK